MTSKFKSNNKSIFKATGNLIAGWTTIPNGIMNDIPKMTPDAFTVFAKILQYISNPDHKISIQGLATQTGLTKDRVSKGLNKLIDIGYIVRTPIKNGNLTNGYIYEVYDSPQRESVDITTSHRNPEIKDTEAQDTEFQYANKENSNNYNIKKENIDEDDASKIIDLFKTFKLEKRVLPHTTKLLKDNSHIQLEVFNEIFIAASGDDVKKKYQYLKEIIKNLNENKVITISDYENYCNKHKESKIKPVTTKGSTQVKTRFHNINQTFTKYSESELEIRLQESQKPKFKSETKTEEIIQASTEDEPVWDWNV